MPLPTLLTHNVRFCRGVRTQGSLPHPAEDPESRRGAEGRDQALKAGLVREIKAKTGMEAWRRDEETGQAYSLKLTDAGLKAIAADERGSQSIPSTAVPQNTNEEFVESEDRSKYGGGPERNGRTNSGKEPAKARRSRG